MTPTRSHRAFASEPPHRRAPRASVRRNLVYYTGPEHPPGPVWSLGDLESNPVRQKALRARLETKGVDEFQFLRWRNAMLKDDDLPASVAALSYGLLPTSSIFSRSPHGGTVLTDEVLARIGRETPTFVIENIIGYKLTAPEHIPSAVDLLRYHDPEENRKLLAQIIIFCIMQRAHSVLPRLLRALRDDIGVDMSIYGPVLRVLVTGPVVCASAPGHPLRTGRYKSQRATNPTPGPYTNLVTFDTYNEIRLIVSLLLSRDIKIDTLTYAYLVNASPALPSSIIRMLNRDGATTPIPVPLQYRFNVLARSLSHEGRTHAVGLELSRLRRLMFKSGDDDRIPVSAAFDKDQAVNKSNPSSSPSTHTRDVRQLPPHLVKGRGVIASVNLMFLNAWKRDRRARDTARFPHAVVAYFRRLQSHFDAQSTRPARSAGSVAAAEDDVPPAVDAVPMIKAWNTFLTAMAAQRGFPADKLLLMLDAVSKVSIGTSPGASTGLQLQIPTITACILGLIRHGQYESAVTLWRRFLADGQLGRLDWAALSAGGKALSESGRLVEAFELFDTRAGESQRQRSIVWSARRKMLGKDAPLDAFLLPESQSVMKTLDTESTDTVSQEIVPAPSPFNNLIPRSRILHESEGALQFLTTLMRTLAFRRRPDVVYALWDSMEKVYDVRPNNHTLNTLLVTASSYSAPSEAVSISQQMGWRGSNVFRRSRSDLSSEETVEQIKAALVDEKQAKRKDVGFWWGDKPAWQVARGIFREVILGNWPELAVVPPPAVAANPDGFHPLIGLSQLRTSLRPGKRSSSSSEASPNAGRYIRPVTIGKYYDIIPDQRTFDAYIRLLCVHGQEHEIPDALMWARELGIMPSHNTLRLALMWFSTIGESAPFDEAVLLEHGAADSPYGRLKAWVRDWVPRGYVPTQNEIERERRLWGASRDHPEREELAKRHAKRLAKWRRSRKDMRKRSWQAKMAAQLTEKARAAGELGTNDSPVHINVW